MTKLEQKNKKMDNHSLDEMLSIDDNSKHIEKIVESILSSLETDITDLDRMMYSEMT